MMKRCNGASQCICSSLALGDCGGGDNYVICASVQTDEGQDMFLKNRKNEKHKPTLIVTLILGWFWSWLDIMYHHVIINVASLQRFAKLVVLWGTYCFWDCAHHFSEVAGRKVSRQNSSELWHRPWLLNYSSLLQRFWAKASWLFASCCELLSACEVLWNDFHCLPLSLCYNRGRACTLHNDSTRDTILELSAYLHLILPFNSQQPALFYGYEQKRHDIQQKPSRIFNSNCCAHRWAGLADPRTSNETCQKDEISRSLKIFWSSQLKFNVRAMLYRGLQKTHGHTRGALICRTHGRNEQCVLAVNMLSVCKNVWILGGNRGMNSASILPRIWWSQGGDPLCFNIFQRDS